MLFHEVVDLMVAIVGIRDYNPGNQEGFPSLKRVGVSKIPYIQVRDMPT